MQRRFWIPVPPHWTATQAEWAHHLLARIHEAIWDVYETNLTELNDLRTEHPLEFDLGRDDPEPAEGRDLPPLTE